MSDRTKRIIDWQQRYHAQPQVWTVYALGEETGNIYDSREAAEIEVTWRRNRGEHNVRVASIGHVQSVELARDRWKGDWK